MKSPTKALKGVCPPGRKWNNAAGELIIRKNEKKKKKKKKIKESLRNEAETSIL
jgi:hypothetical protein